jgi:hypothetical protein
MAEPALSLDEFFGALSSLGIGTVPLRPLADEQRKALAGLAGFDPLKLAATFGGLLTLPALQSNCIRLEVLVHLSLALGGGTRKPNEKLVAQLFTAIGKGIAGRKEDPAEDIFVSLIRTRRGNFRILEGVWESSGFYLERVVNALELIPPGRGYDHMREAVYALLRLSEAVCERAKLVRYELGNEIPQGSLSGKILSGLGSFRRTIRFTDAELNALGVSVEHLGEFGFDAATREGLIDERIGHSTLERYPVAYRNGELFVLLPTAISAAIRRYVIEQLDTPKLREAFAATLGIAYANLISDTPLLGLDSGAPAQFQKTGAGLLAGASTRVDHGLYINFVFFIDTLDRFESDGLIGVYPPGDPAKLRTEVDEWIDHAYNDARKIADFRGCLTVLVACGVGRGIVDITSDKKRDNWRLEFISASDLMTLSWLPDFKALSLWRLLDAQDRLEQLGVTLQNINGLLNMVAWARSLGGHLVPHGDLPDDFTAGDTPKFLMIEQNALRKVRHEVDTCWDEHVIQDVDGHWVISRKEGEALFEEDRHIPFYVADERRTLQRWPRCIYETSSRAWWIELETTPATSGYWAFERTRMLKTWLCRIAPLLEKELPQLPTGALVWRVKFEGEIGDKEGDGKREFMSFEAALSTLTVEATGRSVALVATPDFENAIFHPENIAERALVYRTVEGFAALAGRSLSTDGLEGVVREIVQNASARQSHAFAARRFRDFVRDSVWRKPITIDADDAAVIKLGLGWGSRDPKLGGDIQGKQACTEYLNLVVRLLEDELCQDLRELDRRSVITFALTNHESAIYDRDNWNRTAAAVLALHKDKEAALRTMAEHQGELNAVFQSTRLLVEFAICECPLTGGREPGQLDMSRLMAKVLEIAGLGGWSDAIYWDAMEPRLRVTPLGDIHGNVTFHKEILAPYGRAGADLTVQRNVEDYAENLSEPEAKETDTSKFAPEFVEALEEQFGAPFDGIRKFIDALEDVGMEQKRAIVVARKSILLGWIGKDGLAEARTAATLTDYLTFKGRAHWRDVPAGYDERDLFPWRFRRRLSVLRKPIIQLDDAEDPTLIVAPGIARDAFVYMIGNYHRGDFPLRQLSPKMKRWAGESRKRMGREFSEAVAKRLRQLGWNAETEVRVTKLLKKGFERDYGDVDVLAWRADTNRVLIIECKDVQHRKTDGEIAEQLADFRGELDTDGKPDLLLRHLRRIEVISQHPAEVAKYLGFSGSPRIEGHLVFKNPVPMKFAWQRMKSRVKLHLFSELDRV